MKQGQSISDLAVELQRRKNAQRDFIAPTMELFFDSNSPASFVVGDKGAFAPTPWMEEQTARHIGYPTDFFRRSMNDHQPEATALINAMLHASKGPRMVRTLDGSARAFMSNRYRRIDNFEVAEVALDTIAHLDGWTVMSQALTETHLYLKAFAPDHHATKRGDLVRVGFALTNSEIGQSSVNVEYMIEILACTNGAVMRDLGVKRNHIGGAFGGELSGASELFSDYTNRLTDGALLAQIGDVIRATVDQAKVDNVLDRIDASQDKVIEGDPVKAVVALQKQAGLNDGERGGILNHLIKGGELSQWGLSNAVTAFAQDDSLSYDRATELERIGGNIIDLPADKWSVITKAAISKN